MMHHRLTNMTVVLALATVAAACEGKPPQKNSAEAKAAGADAEAKAGAAAEQPADAKGGGAEVEVREGGADAPAAVAGEQASPRVDEQGEALPGEVATCATASANLMALMAPELEKQLQQMPEERRAAVEQQMKEQVNLEAITAQCEQASPDQKELDCVVNAKSMQELQGCQPPGGAPPPGASPGHPVPPPPGPGVPMPQTEH
jgi:hypothetical protein